MKRLPTVYVGIWSVIKSKLGLVLLNRASNPANIKLLLLFTNPAAAAETHMDLTHTDGTTHINRTQKPTSFYFGIPYDAVAMYIWCTGVDNAKGRDSAWLLSLTNTKLICPIAWFQNSEWMPKSLILSGVVPIDGYFSWLDCRIKKCLHDLPT